jgi:putative MFS transporter
VPESPRWLARHDKLEDADRILLRLEKQIFGEAEPPALLAAPATKFKTSVNFGDLFRGIYLKRTICVWIMWLCASVNAWGLLLWMPSLLHTAYRLSVAQSLRYSMIGNIFVVIGGTTGAYVIDRMGRKALFEVTFLLAALPLLLVGMIHGPTGRTVLILATMGNASITVAELALSMYSSEIYPTRMRTLGTGTAGSWARGAAMITSPLIGLILSVTHEASAVFLFLSGLAFLGVLTVFLFATETSGRVLEEISP